MKNSYDIDFAKNDEICSQGLLPPVVYIKQKEDLTLNIFGKISSLPYQRISFKGSCFERFPEHYFFGRQDKGSATTPFLQEPYKYLIRDLAKYHYLKVWDVQNPDPKTTLASVKKYIKESNKILLDKKERKSVHSFLTAYGKLMKDSIKTRKLHRDELKNKKKKEKEKRIADLKNRVRKPINIDEAAIYFGAGGCCVPIYSTPYEPDNELYTFVGFVKGKLNGKYVLEIDNDILGKRKFLLDTPEVFNEGALIQAVGKFSEVAMLRTLFLWTPG